MMRVVFVVCCVVMVVVGAWLVLVWAPANVPPGQPYAFTNIQPGPEQPYCVAAGLLGMVVVFVVTLKRIGR